MKVYICMAVWVQLFICKFARGIDNRYAAEVMDPQISSLQSIPSIQGADRAPRTPSVKVNWRRYKETEPLLSPSSLSSSVPIDVVPSLPQGAPIHQGLPLPSRGTEQAPPQKNASESLPPIDEVVALLYKALPRKTHIRALQQISEAFTLQDVLVCLTSNFTGVVVDRALACQVVLSCVEKGWIVSATQQNLRHSTRPSTTEMETALFRFASMATPGE